jgi:hypothetical protein
MSLSRSGSVRGIQKIFRRQDFADFAAGTSEASIEAFHLTHFLHSRYQTTLHISCYLHDLQHARREQFSRKTLAAYVNRVSLLKLFTAVAQ